MKVGILGSGDVGCTLGSAFVELGHSVCMGSRDAENPRAMAWAESHDSQASHGTFATAASFGELIVLATRGVANEAVLRAAGLDGFDDKIVIDTTNPLDFSRGGPPTLALGHTDSGGELVQRLLPRARVVKAFNAIGAAHMFRPEFPGGPASMFICGNDATAKANVAELVLDFGWPSIDAGAIEGARLLEPLAALWVHVGFSSGAWNHAFHLLRR